METRGSTATEKLDAAWSVPRDSALGRLTLTRGVRGVSEFFDRHAELPRERNRLRDRGLSRALLPRRQRLAAHPQSPRQVLLTEGGADANASHGAELCQAIHVFHMVPRDDAVLSRLIPRLRWLDIIPGPVAGSCEEGPRCANSRPHGQTLKWRADEMTVPCLGLISLGRSEFVAAAYEVSHRCARGEDRNAPANADAKGLA